MEKKHILVTGGAGYIGSHAAWQLREAGFIPVVIDNLIHGHAWAVKFGPFVQGDIGDRQFIRSVCEQYQPLALMHFAAFIEVGDSVQHPEKFWDNNFERAKTLFTEVKDCGIRHVVFSSSAAVYSVPVQEGLITENTPLLPLNPYGESKKAAEQFLRSLDTEGITSMILRNFNAAGAAPTAIGIGEAHYPESHLIPRVILAALGHEPYINVFGTDYPTPDGTALRDYIHVTDLVQAHISALQYLLAGRPSDVCNLGTGVGYSVKQVIDAVAQYIKCTIQVRYGQRREGDPPVLVADIKKAHTLLQWQPKQSFQEIISSAVAWHGSLRI